MKSEDVIETLEGGLSCLRCGDVLYPYDSNELSGAIMHIKEQDRALEYNERRFQGLVKTIKGKEESIADMDCVIEGQKEEIAQLNYDLDTKILFYRERIAELEEMIETNIGNLDDIIHGAADMAQARGEH